jgi:hypothetical protein
MASLLLTFRVLVCAPIRGIQDCHITLRWLRSSKQFPRFDKCHSTGFEGCGNFMRRPRRVAG